MKQLTPPPLRLECLHDLEAVLPDWRQLEATGACTAFQTRAWLLPLYRELAPRLALEPLFLRVSDASSGRTLMLWPLLRGRHLGMRFVRGADAGISDYNAPLVAPQWPRVALAAQPAWQAAWRDAWRRLPQLPGLGGVLHVDKLPGRIGALPNPLLALRAAGARGAPMGFGAWAVELPGGVEQYTRMLAPGFAKDLALRRRRLLRHGELRLVAAQTEAERRTAFETLCRQRARRFAETGRVDLMAHPAYRRYYEAVAVQAPGRTVRLFTLFCGAVRVAQLLVLDHDGTRHAVLPSFEGDAWRNCSPGSVMFVAAIEDAIAGGLRRFDFTIGDEAYKAGFGAQRTPVHTLLQPCSLPGRAYAAAREQAQALRRRWQAAPEPAAAQATRAAAADAS